MELTITEARKRLLGLKVPKDQEVTITKRGKPVMALLDWELYEAIVETLDVMGDPELMNQVKKSIKDIAEGRVSSWESAKKELGL